MANTNTPLKPPPSANHTMIVLALFLLGLGGGCVGLLTAGNRADRLLAAAAPAPKPGMRKVNTGEKCPFLPGKGKVGAGTEGAALLTPYSLEQTEVTNGSYAAVLNWALEKGRLESWEEGPVRANGRVLLDTAARECQIRFVRPRPLSVAGYEIPESEGFWQSSAGKSLRGLAPQDMAESGGFAVRRREGFSMADHPVVAVTWHGALAYCNWLSEMQGLPPCYDLATGQFVKPVPDGYRLPTGPEWEMGAAWIGDALLEHSFFGRGNDTINWKQANPLKLRERPYTAPVGLSRMPSPCGLLDMTGNVWEWCHPWPPAPAGGDAPAPQTVRGGGWTSTPEDSRSARAEPLAPDTARQDVGFRVARSEAAGTFVYAQVSTAPTTASGEELSLAPPPPPEAGDTRQVGGIPFVYCPPGSFSMGSPSAEKGRQEDEGPVHQVTFTRGFWISQTEITVGQWTEVTGAEPAGNWGTDKTVPVSGVSWKSLGDFTAKLAAREGGVFRAPTEAEWEYACRAGSDTAFSHGEDAAQLADYAWFAENSGNKPRPAGTRKPNAWGIHDMHGNLWEWCAGEYAPYTADPLTDPAAAPPKKRAGLRGGSYSCKAPDCRSANRYPVETVLSSGQSGARIVMETAPSGQTPEETRSVRLDDGVVIELAWCPPGTFIMGDNDGNADERPPHRVTLSSGFWMGKTEVTQAQWEAVMGENPSRNKGKDLPVEQVSWEDCRKFTEKMAGRGLACRLPTEAEWEYACLAGGPGPYCFGDDPSGLVLGEHAWFNANSDNTTHPAGKKKPNWWGLHDMHGNVHEWCADWQAKYPEGDAKDPAGAAAGTERVCRGSSYKDALEKGRAKIRRRAAPDIRNDALGLRLVFPAGTGSAAAKK